MKSFVVDGADKGDSEKTGEDVPAESEAVSPPIESVAQAIAPVESPVLQHWVTESDPVEKKVHAQDSVRRSDEEISFARK